LDTLAGADLNEVEINLVQAKRESAQAKKKLKEEAKKANEQELADRKKANKEEKKDEAPVFDATRTHKTVKCDVCQMFPIVGVRYRCAKFVMAFTTGNTSY
jgi:hypothetical protein